MKKVMSDIYERIVKESLFEDENTSTEVLGNSGYIVKAMCTTPENEEAFQQEFSVQAESPEAAKTAAMIMSKEMGHTTCQVSSVDLIPNSDEALNNYGSGEDLNTDDSKTSGLVTPSDVSVSLESRKIKQKFSN